MPDRPKPTPPPPGDKPSTPRPKPGPGRVVLLAMLALGLMLGLSSCLDAPSPVGCVSTVNGKCVQTGTKPPAMF